MKLNIVGDTFTYRSDGNKGYSVHQMSSDNIEWTQDGTGEATVYVDLAVKKDRIPEEHNGKRYIWLYESKYIAYKAYEDFYRNKDWYLSNFDLIFAHDQDVLATGENTRFVPANGSWIKNPKICDKTKLVSMISSNKNFTRGHHERLQWVSRLRHSLDLYGRGFNEIESKEQGLCDYMFSVAIENGNYSSYFTEKIIDCFATGTIPVYSGTPDIGDFFDTDGIITLDANFKIGSLSPDDYYDRLPAIKNNFEAVQDYLMPEDYMYSHYFK